MFNERVSRGKKTCNRQINRRKETLFLFITAAKTIRQKKVNDAA